MGDGLIVLALIFLAVPTFLALWCYRTGAFFDWRLQRRARQDAPISFWIMIAAYFVISLLVLTLLGMMIAGLAYRALAQP
jgi:hypothetical protein